MDIQINEGLYRAAPENGGVFAAGCASDALDEPGGAAGHRRRVAPFRLSTASLERRAETVAEEEKFAGYICTGCGIGERLDAAQLESIATRDGKMQSCKQHGCSAAAKVCRL